MAYITGKDFKLEVDITGSESWQEADIVSADVSWGEVVDTFYKLNSDVAQNKVTALDPEFGFTIKYDDGDTLSEFLLTIRHTTTRSLAIRITDTADGTSGATLTFNGELTAISETMTIEEVRAIDITFKVADGTITRTSL